MQKSNHICYNTCKHACFKLYNAYTNSMLKYRKKVVKKACNLHCYNNIKFIVDKNNKHKYNSFMCSKYTHKDRSDVLWL